MIQAEITINDAEWKNLMDKLINLNPKKSGAVVFNAFKQSTFVFEAGLKKNTQKGILRQGRGRGFLARSMQTKIIKNGRGFEAQIGSGARTGNHLPYASIHETGGIIRAKSGKWLAIPVPSNRSLKSPREYKNTFIAGDFGSGVIMQRMENKKKSVKALFLLRKQVKIPARKYMTITKNQNINKARSVFIENLKKGIL